MVIIVGKTMIARTTLPAKAVSPTGKLKHFEGTITTNQNHKQRTEFRQKFDGGFNKLRVLFSLQFHHRWLPQAMSRQSQQNNSKLTHSVP
jgi:hypothetical protein